MNERIRELAEQAAWRTRMAHNNAYWRMQDDIAEDATWREKFAELIVGECLEIVEDEDDGSQDTLAVRWAMHRIRKHFGVE